VKNITAAACSEHARASKSVNSAAAAGAIERDRGTKQKGSNVKGAHKRRSASRLL